MENLKKYNEIFIDVFSVSETGLGELFTRNNVSNWDSIHQLNLISYIEEVFDIILDTEDILDITSYNNGQDILSGKYGISF